MGCIRIETELIIPTAASARRIREAQSYLNIGLTDIQSRKCYWLEDQKQSQEDLKEALQVGLKDVFFDPVMEQLILDSTIEPNGVPSHVVEVAYRAGVTDNVAHSAEEALALLGADNCNVATGHLHYLYGDLTHAESEQIAHALLGNPLIQRLDIWSYRDWINADRFAAPSLPKVILERNRPPFECINVERPMTELLQQSVDNCWALSEAELAHIQKWFGRPDVQASRKALGLPLQPTDVEIEVIAQSWSEHCKHKIFAATVEYTEGALPKGVKSLGDQTIHSLFKSYVRRATQEIEAERQLPWLCSVFHDNAGVVRFDSKVDLAIKVETHNSPSALDPYGGAITGILGVNRDIIGVGMGARPVANMDVFCFADPKWPLEGDEDKMPVGLMHPRRLLEGVHKGVEDGGNMSGIPTVNGAIVFDQDYAGKPLVFVGTVGVMPHQLPDGTEGTRKVIQPKDRIFMVGGAIGADGIHGATFSSLELNENSPATAVQIGDPITQKRALDFLLEARDLGLFRCITDNGAGGLSSSVGEMATLSDGAELDLRKAPTKYPGLQPWELMISESQERMTVAVPPENASGFNALAQRRGVVATDIGQFTNSGALRVSYGDTIVAELDLSFLHDSLPPMVLPARWTGPIERRSWIARDDRVTPEVESIEHIICQLLKSPNVVSKAAWVRQYDHEVQGATHIKPFGGESAEGPNDSGVIWLYPHGGSESGAAAIGCGLAPRISLEDPYLMAQYAVDEAIRNVVATGGDIDTACILDNFCWPDPVKSTKTPDGDLKMGQLVRCCHGLYDIAKSYGTPLVSGKDSMKNDFRGKNGKGEPLTISILPTLLVTAMAKAKLGATQSSGFKAAGDVIYQLGITGHGLRGSEFACHYHLDSETDHLNPIDLRANKSLYRIIHQLLQDQLLNSVHDISDGGLICAISESCFGNDLGASLKLDGPLWGSLFGEAPGQFVVSVPADKESLFVKAIGGLAHQRLGTVTESPVLSLVHPTLPEDNQIPIATLKSAWTEEL